LRFSAVKKNYAIKLEILLSKNLCDPDRLAHRIALNILCGSLSANRQVFNKKESLLKSVIFHQHLRQRNIVFFNKNKYHAFIAGAPYRFFLHIFNTILLNSD
jgi:hypothetical protein